MCLSSSMASPHHRVGDTGSLYVRKVACAQRLQEVSFPSRHCSWETPGLLPSLLHHCSWHHGCLGYLFMSQCEARPIRAGFVVMVRRIEDEGMEREFLLPGPILALPAAVAPVPALSSLVKCSQWLFVCVQKKKRDNPNVYIFYCLTQQTYRAPFCKALDKMQRGSI